MLMSHARQAPLPEQPEAHTDTCSSPSPSPWSEDTAEVAGQGSRHRQRMENADTVLIDFSQSHRMPITTVISTADGTFEIDDSHWWTQFSSLNLLYLWV